MAAPHFTLGIEEEFQIVDAGTGELRSGSTAIQTRAHTTLRKNLQSELVDSMIELTTDVCPDIATARGQVYSRRAQLAVLAAAEGLALISAGTHPTSPWQTQDRTSSPRYAQLEEEFQDVVRSRVIFGLHVHIGIEDLETAIALINPLRTWLPHLLALSANSPFWLGRLTGLQSYRTVVWQSGSPRNGLPEVISSPQAFTDYVHDLVTLNVIAGAKDLWWDVRPHPVYPTIEFRICDMPATMEHTLAIAALCQALVATLHRCRMRGEDTASLPRDYIAENKWRAARFGLDGMMLDFARSRAISTRASIRELLGLVHDAAVDLGSEREMDFLHRVLDPSQGSGADEQIAVYRRTGDFHAVTRFLIEQTMTPA